MATTQEIGIDSDFLGNALNQKGIESVAQGVITSPASLGASANDYAPTGIQTTSILKVSSTLAVSITGLVAPNPSYNKLLYVFNSGNFNITLSNQSGSSASANRFDIGGDIVLSPKSGATLYYDIVLTKWVCLGRTTSASSSATITGSATLSGQVIFNGDLTDTINANTNNYNPVGLSNANCLNLNCTGAFNLTGIQAQPVGCVIIITNTNNVNTLTIVNNSVSSLGANRFLMNANVVLAPNQSCMVKYDLTNARWRMISHL